MKRSARVRKKNEAGEAEETVSHSNGGQHDREPPVAFERPSNLLGGIFRGVPGRRLFAFGSRLAVKG